MMQSVRMEKSLCDIQPETISDFTQKNVKRIKQDRGPSPARGFSKELTREKPENLIFLGRFFFAPKFNFLRSRVAGLKNYCTSLRR